MDDKPDICNVCEVEIVDQCWVVPVNDGTEILLVCLECKKLDPEFESP